MPNYGATSLRPLTGNAFVQCYKSASVQQRALRQLFFDIIGSNCPSLLNYEFDDPKKAPCPEAIKNMRHFPLMEIKPGRIFGGVDPEPAGITNFSPINILIGDSRKRTFPKSLDASEIKERARSILRSYSKNPRAAQTRDMGNIHAFYLGSELQRLGLTKDNGIWFKLWLAITNVSKR